MEQPITTVFEADEVLSQISDLKEKINAAESERDTFIEIYQAKIARANEQCDAKTVRVRQEIALLEESLRRFAADNLPEGKKSISLPSGNLSFRKQAPKFFFGDKEVSGNNEQLIEFCKANLPEYVKTKVIESADWSEMKKRLTFDAGKVFFADTGELLSGLTVQEFPDKFTVATA